MFTLQQIKDFHSIVKSGADFPQFIDNIKSIGVAGYDVFVVDGHATYFGLDGFSINSEARYDNVSLSEKADNNYFLTILKSHQNGETDYSTFISEAAKSGVYKWTVDTQKMICTYYDKDNNEMLQEIIPTSNR